MQMNANGMANNSANANATNAATPKGLLVVVSQGQSRSPDKRGLEESIATHAAKLPFVTCLVVPNLYDLAADSVSVAKLRQWQGPIVVHSWLFDRAAHWVLDRIGIQGQRGDVELINPDLANDDDDEDESSDDVDEKADERVASIDVRPERRIYSIDLRSSSDHIAYINEIQRILSKYLEQFQSETHTQNRSAETLSLERFLAPTNSTALAIDGSGILDNASTPAAHHEPLGIVPLRIDEHPTRRWYPVIDYSRCTNCMECIDFCLFGVYGVDRGETISVDQPDNCRKGCPACSRVCPENAIMFPQHKTPAIAGAPVDASGFKIDLSKLFGAPERDEDAIAAAARERDEQLILAGRAAVGLAGLVDEQPTTGDLGHANEPQTMTTSTTPKSKDQFDSLIDELDKLDL